MDCPGCGGKGCGGCDAGKIVIDSCPMARVGRKENEAIRYASYARESSMWPVTGGALEQTQAFLTVESFIRQDRAAWRAEQGLTT